MPQLSVRSPCQIVGHYIRGYGHQHQNYCDYQPPIMMSMFPVRTMKTMMITVVF